MEYKSQSMALSARDAITHFNTRLLEQLPLESGVFFAMVKQAYLFPRDTADRIAELSTRPEKVSYFLQHVIEPEADVYLPKLLGVMEESEDLNVVRLADEIQAVMKSEEIQEYKENELSSSSELDLDGNFKELYSQAVNNLGSEELHLCKVIFFGPPGVGTSSLCRVLINHPVTKRENTGVFDLKLVQFKVKVTKHDIEEKSVWNIVTLQEEIEWLRRIIERKLNKQNHPTEIQPAHQKKVSLEDGALPDIEKDKNIHKMICQRLPDSLTSKKIHKVNNIIISLYDSGGQPEFFDVIPLLHTLPTVNVMVFNMNEPLEAKIHPELYEKGHLVSTGKQTHYTNAELMKMAIASIESKQVPSCSNILVVGTHLDTYTSGKDNIEESLSQLDNELSKTVFSDSNRKMIAYYKRKSKENRIIHPISTTEPSEEQNEVAQKIRTAIEALSDSANTKTEIPNSWLLLQYQIRLLGKPCITLSHCKEIAEKICYVEEDVKVVLRYFHDLGILLYYEELDNVVFCNPQWLFEQLSKLIRAKYSRSYKADVENGIVSKTFMAMNIFSSLEDDTDNIIKLNNLLKLFSSLNIMIKLPKRGLEDERHFMPALLDPSPQNLPLLHLGEKCYDTLYVMYKGSLFPRGMFCCIVTLTQEQGKFTILENKDYMYKNLIVFQDRKENYLVLSDKLNYMTVDVYQREVQNQYNQLQIQEIHCELLHTLHEVCKKMKLNYQFEFGFACQKSTCQERYSKESTTGIAIVDLTFYFYPKVMCCKSCKMNVPLNYNQLLWFIPSIVLDVLKAEHLRQSDAKRKRRRESSDNDSESDANQDYDKQVTSRQCKVDKKAKRRHIKESSDNDSEPDVNSRPSMKELQRLRIIHTIAPKWYELGIELLDEDQLPRLSIIKSNHMEVSRCCSEMLMFWLNNHHDATWYQLMVALREPGVEMHNVAAMIEAEIIDIKKPLPPELKQFEAPDKVDECPVAEDFSEYIVSRYSPHWKILGILLDVPIKTVNATAEKNNEDRLNCCKEMLEGWLSSDPKASWRKLLEAVRSLPE